VVCLLAGACAMLAWSSGRLPAPPATVVATVDLERVLNGMNEKTTKEAELKDKIGELNLKIEDLKKQVDAEKAKFDALPEGADKKAKAETLRRLLYQLEFERQFGLRVLGELEGDLIRELYAKITAAVHDLAQRNGYTIVLANDEQVEVPQGNAENVQRTISLKRMLYVNTAHDITDELILMMNAQHGAGAGARGAANK